LSLQARLLLSDKLSQNDVFYPFKVIQLYRSAIYYSPAASFPGSIYLFIHLNNDFMWKRFAVAAMACIIITTHPVAQIIQPLSVGDTVSSEKVFPLLNDKDSLFNLSLSKVELLLLDFWVTWCTSCIAKFPKLDSSYLITIVLLSSILVL